VIIQAPDEDTGVRAEHCWLQHRYPGYHRGAQALIERDGRHYDMLQFSTASGETREACFDITAFFGKQ